MSTFDQESYLQQHILYRLRSVAWFVHLANGTRTWARPRQFDVYLDGKRIITGPHHFLTNPAVEVGIIYSRVLLEFLGLRTDRSKTRLDSVKLPRRRDSVGIENFKSPTGPLRMVTPTEAFSCYPGPAPEAEKSLVTIFNHADQGVAHLTKGPAQDEDSYGMVVLGAEGVLTLVTRFLYRPLRLPDPDYQIKKQPHQNSPADSRKESGAGA